MNEEHIEIAQPENTNRYWCPIDVPALLDTEENEIAYATKYCNWTPTVVVDGEEVENPMPRKEAICRHLRAFMVEEYKALYVETVTTQAREQAISAINQIL